MRNQSACLSRQNGDSVPLISVVDDDESIRDSTRSLLRSMGYQVEVFESGERFLASPALLETDCLILDVCMPGMGGLELQLRVGALNVGIPIIFITSHADSGQRQRAIDAGASHFFQKPFASGEFLAAISTALAEKPHPDSARLRA